MSDRSDFRWRRMSVAGSAAMLRNFGYLPHYHHDREHRDIPNRCQGHRNLLDAISKGVTGLYDGY